MAAQPVFNVHNLTVVNGHVSNPPTGQEPPNRDCDRENSPFNECPFVSESRCVKRSSWGMVDDGLDFDYWANATFAGGTDENHWIGSNYRDYLESAVGHHHLAFLRDTKIELLPTDLLFRVMQDQVRHGAFENPRMMEVLDGFWSGVSDEWQCALSDDHVKKFGDPRDKTN